MSEWTHRVCERCWFDGSETFIPGDDGRYELRVVEPVGAPSKRRSTADLPDDAYLMPVQVKDPEPGVCCYCGGLTITGIFTRQDENEVLCRGRHDDPSSWSRVKISQSPA